MKQKTIVISGVNMVEGGIFTILDNCLQKISKYTEDNNLKIIALVQDSSKFKHPNITYLSFPKSKKYWVFRLYYEYFYFNKISKKIKPDIWFSLHDISPNVQANKRFVYCHHPSVFYNLSVKDWRFDFKIGLFSLFYKYLYQINIRKNEAVFVQQNWIKQEFKNRYKIANVVTCKPEFVAQSHLEKVWLDPNRIHFFYPLLPKSFKNIELIGDAIQILPPDIRSKIKVHITIQATDSSYAKFILSKYKMTEINYIGKISLQEVFGYYKAMDCLLFPSKMETWGLPLSEAKAFRKPIFAANLAYAKETIGDYQKVSFFDAFQPNQLARLITDFTNNTIQYQGNKSVIDNDPQLSDWFSIFNRMLND